MINILFFSINEYAFDYSSVLFILFNVTYEVVSVLFMCRIILKSTSASMLEKNIVHLLVTFSVIGAVNHIIGHYILTDIFPFVYNFVIDMPGSITEHFLKWIYYNILYSIIYIAVIYFGVRKS